MITVLSSVLKCEFFMSQIKYLGQIINAKGRTPNPERAEAIKSMLVPNNVTKLQAFLGLPNYYGIYIPDMQNLRAPLNNLLKKGVKWDWTNDCERAFQKIKRFLISDLFLAHFNPKQEIVVALDTSDYWIDVVILHGFEDGTTKPVADASRTLLLAEKNFSQIEKERLAIIFTVKKFPQICAWKEICFANGSSSIIVNFWIQKRYPYTYS